MDELLIHSCEVDFQAINCCLGVCGDVPDIGIKDGIIAQRAGHYWLECLLHDLSDIALSSCHITSHTVEFVWDI